jgi:hypothetical protein
MLLLRCLATWLSVGSLYAARHQWRTVPDAGGRSWSKLLNGVNFIPLRFPDLAIGGLRGATARVGAALMRIITDRHAGCSGIALDREV